MRARRLWRAGLTGLLLGLACVMVGPAAPASAHAYLQSTDPVDGAVIAAAPDQVTLAFSEPVRLVPDRTLVVGPGGERVDRQEARVDGATVTVPLGEEEAEATGTYLVSYRAISADGHPIAGSITFSVGQPSGIPVLLPDDGDDPALRTAISVTRYLGYAGLVLVVGPALMLSLLWPQRLQRRPVVRLLWLGVGLIGAGALAALLLQVPYTTGGSLSEVTITGVRDVLGTPYGQAHLVRLGVLVAVAVMVRPLAAGRAERTDRLLLGALAVVGLGTWPVAGHPVASPLPAVSIVATTVHLAAAALWIGGLVVLVGFLLRHGTPRELAAILPVWSGWAAMAVVALLVSGLLRGTIEVGTPGALLSTSYGRLLLVKVGLVAVVIGVASFSRKLVRQRLAAVRPRAMRAGVALETVLLAGVVGLSSVLVQTTPARTEAAAGAVRVIATDVNLTLDSELFSLQVQVVPATAGPNTVHLYAFTPTGEPRRVDEWSGTVALPAEGIEPVRLSLQPLTDNHASAEVTLPLTGEWEFVFTVRVSEVDQASVSATVPIR